MAIKDKATTIATALGKLANVKTATVVGNTVEVVGQKDSTAGLKDPQRFVGVVVAKDTTQEPKAMVTDSVKGVDPPEVAVVGYSGSLSGEDGTGAEAVYQATLGDSDFSASSNLTYGTVLEDSIKSGMSLLDTLVTDTYDMLKADLATSLKSDLFLDLPDDQAVLFIPGHADRSIRWELHVGQHGRIALWGHVDIGYCRSRASDVGAHRGRFSRARDA
jgi:hypothetical protein